MKEVLKNIERSIVDFKKNGDREFLIPISLMEKRV